MPLLVRLLGEQAQRIFIKKWEPLQVALRHLCHLLPARYWVGLTQDIYFFARFYENFFFIWTIENLNNQICNFSYLFLSNISRGNGRSTNTKPGWFHRRVMVVRNNLFVCNYANT